MIKAKFAFTESFEDRCHYSICYSKGYLNNQQDSFFVGSWHVPKGGIIRNQMRFHVPKRMRFYFSEKDYPFTTIYNLLSGVKL